MDSNDLERTYQHVATLTDNDMFDTVMVLKQRIKSTRSVSLILSATVMLNACLGEMQLRFQGTDASSPHCQNDSLWVRSIVGQMQES